MNPLSASLRLTPVLAALACMPHLSAADEPSGEYGDFIDAISGGTVDFSSRLRFEYVDQDGVDDTATGLIIDTTLGYKTGSYHGFTAYLQFESVHHIIDDFRYPGGGLAGYPVIADPEVTEVNQVYLDYAVEDTEFKARLGRQKIIYDNSRHIGNVGWRANEVTYDAATVTSKDVENLELNANFLWATNTIFGTNIHYDHAILLNARYSFEGIGKLTGYGYLLDYDDEVSSGTDLSTFGIRFAGAYGIDEDFKALYEAEFASQSDYSDSEDISATYFHLVGGVSWKTFSFKIGYESLGSDDGSYGFSFPLGTNHKFNGWADKFLSTPANGLTDLYFNVAASFPEAAPGLKLAAFYHIFESDENDVDYGSEFDAVATYKYDSHLSFGAKAAFYSADDFSTDTNKVWLWTTFGF